MTTILIKHLKGEKKKNKTIEIYFDRKYREGSINEDMENET